ENQGRNDEDMFDTSIRDDEEVVAEKEVSIVDPVPTTGEVVTTAGVKNKSFEEVQKAFDNTMSWINSFVPIEKDIKLDKQIEAEVDNDKREAKMKMYIKRISDDEIAIDAISLATKPSIIVD
nr:hypothetical protein [Tanacetum cinerariifolium]